MNKTSNFTITCLALAGAAFSQNVTNQIPRGSLLNDPGFEKGSLVGGQNNPINRPIIRPRGVPADSNQLRVENQVAWYKSAELEQRRAYQTCMAQENKKPQPNPYNCQFRLNAANDYARKAAAAQQAGQLDTTQSSQAMRDYLKQLNPGVPPGYFDSIPSPGVPRSSNVGRGPRMPSYVNPNYNRGR